MVYISTNLSSYITISSREIPLTDSQWVNITASRNSFWCVLSIGSQNNNSTTPLWLWSSYGAYVPAVTFLFVEWTWGSSTNLFVRVLVQLGTGMPQTQHVGEPTRYLAGCDPSVLNLMPSNEDQMVMIKVLIASGKNNHAVPLCYIFPWHRRSVGYVYKVIIGVYCRRLSYFWSRSFLGGGL